MSFYCSKCKKEKKKKKKRSGKHKSKCPRVSKTGNGKTMKNNDIIKMCYI